MKRVSPRFARFLTCGAILFSLTSPALPAPLPPQASATAAKPALTEAKPNAEFIAAADEVLKQVSEITGLRVTSPIKKTLRTRAEIRAYVLRQMNEDRTPQERYADEKSAQAFGLLPEGFDLDSFMVQLLTEQIAGLYDPEAHEFYIADWIPLDEQRPVMAHELTHALEDQHFQIEAWLKAARPNDDAELAREAVLEGNAMAVMEDYILRGTGFTLKNLPDIDPSALVGSLDSSPDLKNAPPFIKDSLLFPYFGGLVFTTAVLKTSGWTAIPGIFAKPPLSSQQIMHPSLYLSYKKPAAVELPDVQKLLGSDWKMLDENTLGEFGWLEVLKQFLDPDLAKPLSTAWVGDRYILLENSRDKRLLLITRLRLASPEQAERFAGQYSEALEKKYAQRSNLLRRPNYFSFDTPKGGVFLRCAGADCVTLEGGTRELFAQLNAELGWGSIPEPPRQPNSAPVKTANLGLAHLIPEPRAAF